MIKSVRLSEYNIHAADATAAIPVGVRNFAHECVITPEHGPAKAL